MNKTIVVSRSKPKDGDKRKLPWRRDDEVVYVSSLEEAIAEAKKSFENNKEKTT